MCNSSGCKWHEILYCFLLKTSREPRQSRSNMPPFGIFEAQFISSGCCIRLSKAFHISFIDFMGLILCNLVWEKIFNGYNHFYWLHFPDVQLKQSKCLRTSIRKATFSFLFIWFPKQMHNHSPLIKFIAVIIRHLGNRWK